MKLMNLENLKKINYRFLTRRPISALMIPQMGSMITTFVIMVSSAISFLTPDANAIPSLSALKFTFNLVVRITRVLF